MNALIAFVAFTAISIVGWAIAELKAKGDKYDNSESELEALQHVVDAQRASKYKEMTIKDVIKSISTKGFSAI